MGTVLFKAEDGRVYLERLCYSKERAIEVAIELNEKNNTDIYFVEEEMNNREKDFYGALIGE